MLGLRKLVAIALCLVFALVYADGENHPCTGDPLPLTTEMSIVSAIECLYGGQVAKVSRVEGAERWLYELRVVVQGRVKNILVHPETGLPIEAKELEFLGL